MEHTMCEALIVSVEPRGFSLSGLEDWVPENTEVEVTCGVSRVKTPKSIYWRKGTVISPQPDTTKSKLNSDNITFNLQAKFKVSFNRSEHKSVFSCVLTGFRYFANRTVQVACEYQYVT